VLFYGTVQRLIDLLAGRDEGLDLDRAALQLASIEFPGLTAEPFIQLLDSHAVELAARLHENCSGPEFVAAANRYLFKELGFRGNAADYYDPRNSCLNEVLARRAGIPITLSIVYLEIARRLAKPVHGIGLPGHFLVEYRDTDYSAYIDPFHGGRVLRPEECLALARQVTGADFSADPSVLQPVGKRYMLLRMLNNLRGAYLSGAQDRKVLQVLNLQIEAHPRPAAEYKQRAIIHLRLKRFSAAREDLERYLELAPEAPDRAEAEKQLQSLRQWITGMN